MTRARLSSILTRCVLIAPVLIGCIACDQISKSAARQYLPGTGIHSYLGDSFRFQYAQNPGVFLSLGDSLPAQVRYGLFVVGVSVFLAALLAWGLLSKHLSLFQRIGIAAIGAGGLSNLIDRVRFAGAVTDFLNLGIGSLRTGIFNLADAILMFGVVLLLMGWKQEHHLDKANP